MLFFLLQLISSSNSFSLDIIVVLAIVLMALILFVSEKVPVDVTAIIVMVSLIVLEPWTNISPSEGISGFSNPATITVLAMLILSSGVSNTGLVQIIGRKLSNFAGDNKFKQLFATVVTAGPISGFVNNTPVVAVLVPVITDLAHNGKTSPSKLLIPLSYISMIGGMLTLIGTSTNILASDISKRLLGHPFSMFEFTKLGIIILIVGAVYLFTVGYRLLPERVPPEEDVIEEYDLSEYLTEVVVQEDSNLIDKKVDEALDEEEFDADILQIIRDQEEFLKPLKNKQIHKNDILLIRSGSNTIDEIIEHETLSLRGTPREKDIDTESIEEKTVVEVVIPSGSFLVGESLESSTFRQRYDANVLAFRSRGQVIKERMDHIKIRPGDTLLIQASSDSIDRLAENKDFIVAYGGQQPEYRTSKIPHVIAIITGVVLFASIGIAPILVTALSGVIAMIITGAIKPNEMYDSIDWNVIFLLAGIIPLGKAIEQTGTALLLGEIVANTANFLPLIGVLWVFYIFTGIITGVISNNASVVLMIPVAIEAAQAINANAFAFVLAVTFAASTAFLSPVGYQTNLFVYGPGNYKFSDYFRVGFPLQLLLSVVTVLGITLFWGL